MSDHVDHFGTRWLRQMDLGTRSRVAMGSFNGLIVDGACFSFGNADEGLDVVNPGRRSLSKVRCSRSVEWRWV